MFGLKQEHHFPVDFDSNLLAHIFQLAEETLVTFRALLQNMQSLLQCLNLCLQLVNERKPISVLHLLVIRVKLVLLEAILLL